MLLRTLLQPEDYRSHFGVGLLALGLGALSALIGTSRLFHPLIKNASALDFLQGLCTGFAGAVIVFSVVITARGLVFLRRTGTE